MLAVLWQTLSANELIGEAPLPAPSTIGRALCADADLWLAQLGATLATALAGLTLAAVLALMLAILMDRFDRLRLALYSGSMVSQRVPILFISPPMLIWLDFGVEARFALMTLVRFFPLAVSLVDGPGRTASD